MGIIVVIIVIVAPVNWLRMLLARCSPIITNIASSPAPVKRQLAAPISAADAVVYAEPPSCYNRRGRFAGARQETVTESYTPAPVAGRSRIRWYRPIPLLLALALALAAANLLYAALARPEAALTGAPGTALYAAAFDAYVDEWDLYQGQQSASIGDDALELAVASAQTAAWSAARHRFLDFDIRVSARALAGSIDNAFGIIFDLNAKDETCRLPALILCGLGEWLPLLGAAMERMLEPAEPAAYHAFLISSDGYYSLRRMQNGAQETLSAWIPSPAINQDLNAENVIRVVARGNELMFFVNGQQLPMCLPNSRDARSTYVGGECVDGALHDRVGRAGSGGGRLGLIAEATQTGGGGVIVQFDNVIVMMPGYPSREDARA